VRLWGEREGSMVVIAVADDGVGFDPQVASERAAATGHLGLRSMAERIQTAGGRLEISSRPYQGTQVVLRLPG
jgi:two-component system NarL family sensor kinase